MAALRLTLVGLLLALAAPAIGAEPDAPPPLAPPALPPPALPPPALPTPGAGKMRVLDRVVATVDKQPLMLSELAVEARVALISHGGVEAARAVLTDDILGSTLEFVIGQKLAFAEADRLQVFVVEDDDVALALKAFAGRFASAIRYQDFLLEQELGEDQLAGILRRDLRVARFIDSKVKLSSRVTDAELRRFYEAHTNDFAGQSYAQVREGIRAVLTRERYQKLARAQLDDLRAKGDIRRVASFAAPATVDGSPVRAADDTPKATP